MELTHRSPDRISRGDDQLMFSSSDDKAMQEQVLSTHTPDGWEFEVCSVLHVVESIFRRAKPTAPGAIPEGQLHSEISDDRAVRGTLESLAYTINKVPSEMSCKCMSSGDAHATAMSIFNILSTYDWDAKAVLALAALAIGYGEFWLLIQLYPTNALAKGIAALKRLPEILEQANAFKHKFEALTSLVAATVELAKCIIEFTELPLQYISADAPELSIAIGQILTATYWIIRSVEACSSQIAGLIGMGPVYMALTVEAQELSSLAGKISSIHADLTKQLALCHRLINEKKHVEDVLRRKIVLLLISKIDIPAEELTMLDQMYVESRRHPTRPESQYEILWILVADRSVPWTDEMQTQFECARGMMPWHSVYHPSLINPTVIEYIEEVWKFNRKKVMLVAPWKVVNDNALHMVRIRGSLAYPFTSTRVEALWKEETWRIELLVGTLNPLIFNWVSEGKYVFLYGGEYMEWVREFTTVGGFSPPPNQEL